MKRFTILPLILGFSLLAWSPASTEGMILICPDVPPTLITTHCLQGWGNGIWTLELASEEAIKMEVYNEASEMILRREEYPEEGKVLINFSLKRYPVGTYEVVVRFPGEDVGYSVERAVL